MSQAFANQVFWITGASSGIGEALVYEAVSQGAKVVLSARREAELERVKNNCVHPEACYILPLDLMQIDQFDTKVQAVLDHFGQIDVLINNGGITQRGKVWETDLEVYRRIMEINYFAAVALTQAVLPHMMERKRGHVVGLSSLTGKFGWHERSGYAASKHALDGFMETAHLELKPHNLHTTIVSPGRIYTNISVNALNADGSVYGKMDPGQMKGLSAEKCAKIILRAVYKKKPEVIIGKSDKLMVYFKRFVPGFFRWMAQRVEAN